MKKLYLLTQDINNDYDTYDSCVVIAESEQEAKNIHPNGIDKVSKEDCWALQSWAPIDKITCIEIGTPNEATIKQGSIICASFNAG